MHNYAIFVKNLGFFQAYHLQLWVLVLILDLLCTHSHATAGGVGERLLANTREENCILASVTVYNSKLEWYDIHTIGPVVGVLRCYVALWLYHILRHPPQILYFVYKIRTSGNGSTDPVTKFQTNGPAD